MIYAGKNALEIASVLHEGGLNFVGSAHLPAAGITR
jgi:hypothetical protein